MAEVLRVGILGCGKIAHEDHTPGLIGVKGARIAALCDINPEQMEKLAEKYGLKDAVRFTDPAAYLKSGLIDATVICTPNKLHKQMTLDALKAGLHVLCEKPMAATSAEATKMIEAAKAAGKVLQINHTLRYWPPYIAIAELARRGAIGKLVHLRCLRAGGTSPDVGWSPGAAWFVSKEWEGGIVLDIGVHMAEVMRWAAGPVSELVAVTTTRAKKIDVPDNASVILKFESGATGVLELSWTIPIGANYLEIYGEKGTLRLGFSSGLPLELIKPGKDGAQEILYPELPTRGRNSQQAFYDAVRGKCMTATPGELGRDAVALCEAIIKSGETGKFVAVKQFAKEEPPAAKKPEEAKEAKESKDKKEAKEPKELKDAKDKKETKDSKESKDAKDKKETKEAKADKGAKGAKAKKAEDKKS